MNRYTIAERLTARLISVFSKDFEFSTEWRKGSGFKNWIYERNLLSPVMVNLRLWDLRKG